MCCDLDGFGTHSTLAQTLQLFAHADDGLDCRLELATDIREGVFDRWRRAWLLMTIHDANFDEMTQALREHFCGDAGEIVLQLAEAAWAAAEIPDDVRCPSTAEETHAKLQRTGGGRGCDSAFAARNHDG